MAHFVESIGQTVVANGLDPASFDSRIAVDTEAIDVRHIVGPKHLALSAQHLHSCVDNSIDHRNIYDGGSDRV